MNMTMRLPGKLTDTENILFRYRAAVNEQKYAAMRIEMLKSDILPKSPSLSGMPGGGSQDDKMAAYVAKAEAYERDLKRAEQKTLDEKLSLMQIIDQIEPPALQQLMLYRYVSGARWCDIAEVLKYSEQRIYQLRLEALEKASQIITNQHRKSQ